MGLCIRQVRIRQVRIRQVHKRQVRVRQVRIRQVHGLVNGQNTLHDRIRKY